jgi:hypothetical protein
MGCRVKTAKQIEREWNEFIEAVGGRCWICGRSERDRPRWWNGPFIVERAHLEKCNHPRRNDSRAVLALCSLHHRIQHGDRFPECDDNPLTLPEQLAIKKWVDPKNYDRDFLKTCMIGDPKKLYLPPAASYLRVVEVSWAVRRIPPRGAKSISLQDASVRRLSDLETRKESKR